MSPCRNAGCTLVEIIVSLLVFTVGALGLAAGTAVIAREMGTNKVRADASRLAAGRIETTYAGCRSARSGSESRGGVLSRWTASPLDSTAVRLEGTVSYATARGRRSDSYSATLSCR